MCSSNSSFVITNDGLVYSFGDNEHYTLSHELDENENIFVPKLIECLNNIKSICVFTYNAYFLTNDGILYFCGKIAENNYQKKPKLLENNYKIEEIYSKIIYFDDQSDGVSRAIAINFVSLFDLAI